jgi:chitin disaccharide deacetylase
VRSLIVNADDLGLSPGVNDGVVRGYVCGIVTSASLMVRQPAATSAVASVRAHPGLSIGLHVDLAEWECHGERWDLRYSRVDVADAEAVRRELQHQLELFERLVGTAPSHLDSHQHVHREQPAAGLMRELAARLGVPLRHRSDARYCGSFYGQGRRGVPYPDAITPPALAGLIRDLPEGTTELCCHPAVHAEAGWSYGQERTTELATLCSATVRKAVSEAGVRLLGFRDMNAD